MRLAMRDWFSTLLVGAAAAVYFPWMTGAAMTGWSVREVAGVVFALGFLACVADQGRMAAVYGVDREGKRPPVTYMVLASAAGALALVAGIIAITAGSSVMLATLLAAMGGLWLIATIMHALTPASGSAPTRPARTA